MHLLDSLLERILWVLNGGLALLYMAAGQLALIALAGLLAALAHSAAPEQRPWTLGVSLLCLCACLLAPFPVPVGLLLMTIFGWLLMRLERFNPPAQHWNVMRGLALYALAGLGLRLYRSLNLGAAILADPLAAQGAVYLNALIGISMYLIPLGFLAWAAQALLAHPPAPGTPGELITRVRTRGKG